MNKKLLALVLAVFISSSSYVFTDSLWIVGGEGHPGDLVPVEVWLQYEGGGPGDSISAFNILLTWDATVCTVEVITIGTDFIDGVGLDWTYYSIIDNQGTQGSPAVPKVSVFACMFGGPISPPPVERGTHLATTIDVRILSSAVRGDSACFDTLMQAFSPLMYLGFVDKSGINAYIPSFSTDCIRVLSYSDSLWIMGGQGYPGDLVTAEVWLQYEGGGYGDSITGFDIPLTYNASVCTVEAITIGPDFIDGIGFDWTDDSRIDNHGTQGLPAVPKIDICAFALRMCGTPPVPRGTHLAATLDARILSTVVPPDSTCIDTLMQAFPPPYHLGFVDRTGFVMYTPSFSTGCIRAVESYCGDCNYDGRVTIADAIYLRGYIYKGGPPPLGEADANLDGRITIADAIYLRSFIYKGGPEPCNPPVGAALSKERRSVR